MKRTIDEIFDLIYKKYVNAFNDYMKLLSDQKEFKFNKNKFNELKGQCMAYFDILILIRSSQIEEGDKDD